MPAPLDLHAHISPDASPRDLRELGAYIFAATRSLDEFALTSNRQDERVMWGVGVHPGLVKSQKGFSKDQFTLAIQATPLVSEVGLDGASRVPMSTQLEVFRQILDVLQDSPRLVSVHSNQAQIQVLRELARRPIDGVILHWWTGSAALTEEAVRLGCYFSLPPALMGDIDKFGGVPTSRLLPETDHPFGDRFGPLPRQPGNLKEVEMKLGAKRGKDRFAIRQQFWRNLSQLVEDVGVEDRLPAAWRDVLAHARES